MFDVVRESQRDRRVAIFSSRALVYGAINDPGSSEPYRLKKGLSNGASSLSAWATIVQLGFLYPQKIMWKPFDEIDTILGSPQYILHWHLASVETAFLPIVFSDEAH